MNFAEFQKAAMRTNDGKSTERMVNNTIKSKIIREMKVGGVLNASLGLSGEVGELNDMLKKHIFHGHDLDIYELQKELGDILWYVAMMCEEFGLNMERVAEVNIEKHMKRYPEGFSEEASINRMDK